MTRKGSRLTSLLRAGLAIALLALVAWNVPWRDRLTWTQGETTLEVPGRIEGDWRGDHVRFRVAADAVVEPGWPAEGAPAAGAAQEVTRDTKSAGGWDWRPGLLHVFAEMQAGGIALAVLLLLFSALTAITRWWRLLRIAGCPSSWYDALRLTFIGFFMNLVLPGLTGGDVVKAVLVVRENPQRRADALVTVLVDRGLGLLVLIALAAVVVLVEGERFAEVRWPVVGVFVAVLVALWLLLHPWPRRVLRVDRILERLPQKERLRSVDRALRLYHQHPFEIALALLLSALNHASIVTALYALGHAFGDQLSWTDYLGIAAIANTVSSVPVAPGGWGVGEALYAYLFHLLGAPAALGIAVSVTYRLLNTALGLAGGLFLLLPGGREARAEIEAGGDRDG